MVWAATGIRARAKYGLHSENGNYAKKASSPLPSHIKQVNVNNLQALNLITI